jgi:hypothetical protein
MQIQNSMVMDDYAADGIFFKYKKNKVYKSERLISLYAECDA